MSVNYKANDKLFFEVGGLDYLEGKHNKQTSMYIKPVLTAPNVLNNNDNYENDDGDYDDRD